METHVLEAEVLDKKGLIGAIDKSKQAIDAEHCSCQCACECICICDCDDFYPERDIYASASPYDSPTNLYNSD